MSEPKKPRPAHLQLLAISWNFGWPVAAGVILGHWIDINVGSSPAATLIFGLGAMAGAVWRMIQLGKQEAADRREVEGEQQAQPVQWERDSDRKYRDPLHEDDYDDKESPS